MNSNFILTNNPKKIPHFKSYKVVKVGIDIFLIYSEAPTKFKNKKFTLNIFGKIEGNYHDEFLKRKSIKNIAKH